jgi:type VI secretion system secreted protein VgrG
MLFPRMGWHVATFNEEGGVDAPSLIWRIHDGERPPEYKLPMNMTRVVWKTATVPNDGTTNELYFEDKHGAEEMFINASRDMTYKVLDAHYHTIRNDSTRSVGVNHDLTIKEALDERVILDQTVTIGGDESLTTTGGRIKTVGGNETETVGGGRSLDVNEAHRASVKQSRTLIVGGSMIEITPNNIHADAHDVLMDVGGSVIKIAGEDISEVARKDSRQEIGGAKLDIAKKDHALDVKKEWKETYESSVYLLSNNKYLDNADTTAVWTVTASVSAFAPVGHIQAAERIRFKCGDSVLTLDKEQITLTAKSVQMTGAHIDADSTTIEHN